METQTLSCNNCGAPIDVPPSANFATCSYCKAHLAIKRNASTAYTEVLNQIGENTGYMAEDLRFLRLRQQLQYIDEQWQAQDQQFQQRKNDLQATVAAARKNSRISGAFPALIFGFFLLCASPLAGNSANPSSGLVILTLGCFITVVALLAMVVAFSRRSKVKALVSQSSELQQLHNEAQSAYQSQRAEIVSKLHTSSSGAGG